jgi:CRISPR-associated endonuclease Csn1
MRVLGLDGGIASIGWAVIDLDDEVGGGRIVAVGSRGFEKPETDKERTPTAAVRRLHRGQRRVVRRRRQRMAAIRALLAEAGLLEGGSRDALRGEGLDPWALRAEGLDRRLTARELAVALGHIARHRGFRSNSKRDRGANAASDTSAMLAAIAATRDRLGQWRSVGEMMAQEAEFAARRRNRAGEYSRTVLRADLEDEVRALFAAQRRFGMAAATGGVEQSFARAAFDQRPLQDSEDKVAACLFLPPQKRTARRARSFELFRLLARLAHLRLTTRGGEVPLSPEQIAAVAADFGRQKRITYRAVRTLLDLAPEVRFADVAKEDETRDIVARTGAAAEGTATLRKVLGEGPWNALLHRPALLDRVAEVVTFRESPESIRAGLLEAGLEEVVAEQVMRGVEDGAFGQFRGAGHICAEAARAMLPHLARGLAYSEAAAEVGFDHSRQAEVSLDDVRNPVARRALSEMTKQVRAIVQTHGLPDRIHVELARDVGKGVEERDEISRGIEKRNKERDRLRKDYAELLGGAEPNQEELLRFELWREQAMRCLYTDEAITPDMLRAGDTRVQVDHILPWSRFGDDSFVNKTLCLARANQQKRNRTPWEWFTAEMPEAWEAFERRVESCIGMKGRKKRGFYLRRNAAEVESMFRNRNITDTRYATRVLLGMLARMYPQDGQRHVLARPGALTAKLRQGWGLEGLKKGPDGKRLADDRHHALDALVVAATSEAMLQRLTRQFQEAERRGLPRGFAGLTEPWPGFREGAHAAVEGVFVSRSEQRRARGEAHAATIKQVRVRDGQPVVYVRKAIDKLTLDDLARVKDAERQGGMIAALRAWIEAGKPKDRLPQFPKASAGAQADIDAAVAAAYPAEWQASGDLLGGERREARRLLRRRLEAAQPAAWAGLVAGDAGAETIRSVRVAVRDKPAIAVRGGTADRGEMVRVDVFRETDAKGRARFHLVPIYPHQVADKVRWPKPLDRAVVAYKPEDEWTVMGPAHLFQFSLYPNSLVEVTKPNGEVLVGYFKGLDRSTGAIGLASVLSQQRLERGIGAKTLLALRKQFVDRLGRVADVPREVRTWHGAACT